MTYDDDCDRSRDARPLWRRDAAPRLAGGRGDDRPAPVRPSGPPSADRHRRHDAHDGLRTRPAALSRDEPAGDIAAMVDRIITQLDAVERGRRAAAPARAAPPRARDLPPDRPPPRLREPSGETHRAAAARQAAAGHPRTFKEALHRNLRAEAAPPPDPPFAEPAGRPGTPASDDAIDRHFRSLAERVDRLRQRTDDRFGAVRADVARLSDAVLARPVAGLDPDDRAALDALTRRLDRAAHLAPETLDRLDAVHDDLAALRRMLAGLDLDGRLAALEAGQDAVLERLAAAVSAGAPPPALDSLRRRVEWIAERLNAPAANDGLAALEARLERLDRRLDGLAAPPPHDDAAATRAGRMIAAARRAVEPPSGRRDAAPPPVAAEATTPALAVALPDAGAVREGDGAGLGVRRYAVTAATIFGLVGGAAWLASGPLGALTEALSGGAAVATTAVATTPDPTTTGSINRPGDALSLDTARVRAAFSAAPAPAALPATLGSPALRAAAAGGDPRAALEVGIALVDGIGVTRDPAAAVPWLQIAAGGGLAPAEFRLGTLYERGIGVGRNRDTAKVWYDRAAGRGHVKAMHNLAVLLSEGGEEAATARAADWFRTAASHGLVDSQFNLAVLYVRGLGVTADPQAAYRWFALAARQGDAEAATRRDEIGRDLPPADRADADRAVAEWSALPADAAVNDGTPRPQAWSAGTAPARS